MSQISCRSQVLTSRLQTTNTNKSMVNPFRPNSWKNFWRDSGLGEGDRLNCMFDAFLCFHVSMNLNDFRCCCTAVCECLCIRHSACCLRGAPYKQVAFTTNTPNGEYCRLSAPCCDCAIIPPRLLCGRASQFLCLNNTGSVPFDDEYLAEPVCAYYFISCWPRIGCCVTPPRSKALDKLLNPGLEPIEAIGCGPEREEMERSHALELYKRKNSDDGMAAMGNMEDMEVV